MDDERVMEYIAMYVIEEADNRGCPYISLDIWKDEDEE